MYSSNRYSVGPNIRISIQTKTKEDKQEYQINVGRYIKRSFHPAAWRCVQRDGDGYKEGDGDNSNDQDATTESTATTKMEMTALNKLIPNCQRETTSTWIRNARCCLLFASSSVYLTKWINYISLIKIKKWIIKRRNDVNRMMMIWRWRVVTMATATATKYRRR